MSKKKQRQLISTVIVIILVAIGYFLASVSDDNPVTPLQDYSKPDNILAVNFIDVGQGDCEFIELPNGKCMLIDSGEAENASQICDKISTLGYTKIDFVVVTHPHTDHMGAMSDIINEYEIGDIYMPRVTSTTRTYEQLLTTISDKGLKIKTAKAGKNIYTYDNLSIDILAPISDEYDSLNNYSAVVKITYGYSSFLFMGDAEKLVENELLTNNFSDLDCDVLKVGHHGSKYSSSVDFLTRVSPKFAVISCGEDNSYGHPHSQALERLESSADHIYTTEEYKDIRFETNGDGTYITALDYFNTEQ